MYVTESGCGLRSLEVNCEGRAPFIALCDAETLKSVGVGQGNGRL
jgi:hypothetical protein